MREAGRTTRQRIADRLRNDALAPGEIAREFDVRASEALSHVEHLSRSLESTDEQLFAAPPECEACGFTDFDDLINRPSRCPKCKNEGVTDPLFRIE